MYRSASLRLVTIVLVVLIDRLIAESSCPIEQPVKNVGVRQNNDINYRLPNDTVPETYDITFTTRVDSGDFNFNGVVRIGILARVATQLITLHHRQLTIADIRLTTTTDPERDINLNPFRYDQTSEFLEIPTTIPLEAGARYYLEITYQGILREDNYGLYRSSYTNDAGVQIWQAATQFEPTDARHAFPCYDEPQLKAFFTVTIKHGETYTALSNMPVSTGYPQM